MVKQVEIDGLATQPGAPNSRARFSDDELEAVYTIGYRLSARQMYEEAYGIFATLLLFRPRSVRYLKAAGLCLMGMRRYQSAILPLSAALLLDDRDPAIALACGECLGFLGGGASMQGLLGRAASLADEAGDEATAERARAWLESPETALSTASAIGADATRTGGP
jgi:tetratricopeptide (TPR) repeat protein